MTMVARRKRELIDEEQSECFEKAARDVGANARGEDFLGACERIAGAMLSGADEGRFDPDR